LRHEAHDTAQASGRKRPNKKKRRRKGEKQKKKEERRRRRELRLAPPDAKVLNWLNVTLFLWSLNHSRSWPSATLLTFEATA
jgi:hypothetical protein